MHDLDQQTATLLSVDQHLEQLVNTCKQAQDSVRHSQCLMTTQGNTIFVPCEEGAMYGLKELAMTLPVQERQ